MSVPCWIVFINVSFLYFYSHQFGFRNIWIFFISLKKKLSMFWYDVTNILFLNMIFSSRKTMTNILLLKLEMENWNANFSSFWLIPFRHILLTKNTDKEFPLLKRNLYYFHAEIKFNSLWFVIKKTDLLYLINHWTTSKDLIKKCPLTRKQREGQLRGAVFARERRHNHRGT